MHLAGHAEQAQGSGSRPAAGFNPGCWYNAITLATSTDGGYTFTHAPPPSHLVASVPYKYAQSRRAYGYFSPEQRDQAARRLLLLDDSGRGVRAQQVGACVIRSKTPTNPTSWRAWDGPVTTSSSSTRTPTPTRPTPTSARRSSFPEIEKMVQSLTYSTFFGKYLLVGHSQTTTTRARGEWSTASTTRPRRDLINWSHAHAADGGRAALELPVRRREPDRLPVVLNPGSTARNFDTTAADQLPVLHAVQLRELPATHWDLDLIRIPIKFLGPSPTN